MTLVATAVLTALVQVAAVFLALTLSTWFLLAFPAAAAAFFAIVAAADPHEQTPRT